MRALLHLNCIRSSYEPNHHSRRSGDKISTAYFLPFVSTTLNEHYELVHEWSSHLRLSCAAPTLARLGPFSTAPDDHLKIMENGPQIRTSLSGQFPQRTISSADNFLSGQFPQRKISSAPSSQSDRKRSGNWTCTKSVYELHLSCAKTRQNAPG